MQISFPQTSYTRISFSSVLQFLQQSCCTCEPRVKTTVVFCKIMFWTAIFDGYDPRSRIYATLHDPGWSNCFDVVAVWLCMVILIFTVASWFFGAVW